MTIYALSTAQGLSGIAIIRVSGKDTKKIIQIVTIYGILIQESQLLEKSIKSTLLS